MRILVIDIGGHHVKLMLSGSDEVRDFESGEGLTPQEMIEQVKRRIGDWHCDAISIAYPGRVGNGRPVEEPGNLGNGWVGFDFAEAFGCPVRLIHDASMQALAHYRGGRMLFLGLGTGLGSTLIVDDLVIPLELGGLRYDHRMIFEVVGDAGLEQLGLQRWQQAVEEVIDELRKALAADYVVVGGGNAERLIRLPARTTRGSNRDALEGGRRLWEPAPLVAATQRSTWSIERSTKSRASSNSGESAET